MATLKSADKEAEGGHPMSEAAHVIWKMLLTFLQFVIKSQISSLPGVTVSRLHVQFLRVQLYLTMICAYTWICAYRLECNASATKGYVEDSIRIASSRVKDMHRCVPP